MANATSNEPLQQKKIPATPSSLSKRKFAISKLKMSLDYIFGKGASQPIDFASLDFEYSRKTGRIRHVIERGSGNILFTFRSDGSIAPTIFGAKAMLRGSVKSKSKENLKRPRWTITVLDGVSDFVASGKTVFCRHVVACHGSLLAAEDVVILNEQGELLGVGRTAVPALVMKQFKRGVAVKVREGINSRVGTATIARQ
jgi:archaeosine-15-forming tRNA-guanine transglycosylase